MKAGVAALPTRRSAGHRLADEVDEWQQCSNHSDRLSAHISVRHYVEIDERKLGYTTSDDLGCVRS
jgi:hypothetical protein